VMPRYVWGNPIPRISDRSRCGDVLHSEGEWYGRISHLFARE